MPYLWPGMIVVGAITLWSGSQTLIIIESVLYATIFLGITLFPEEL